MKATTGIKKLFSLLLFMCMLLSMNSPAFAAENIEPPECTEHNWVDGKCTNDGCGLECSHDYVEDAEAYVAPTCTTDGKKVMSCSVCGEKTEDVLPAGHSWGEGVVTTEPTCADAGVKTYTCSGCGETKTEDIDATGIHNYVNGICANDSCGLVATCNKAEDCPAAADHDADCLSQLCDKCGNPNHNNSCPCNKEATCPANDDAHEADCVKKLTDEANKAKIAEVNALIAALPETITVDNYASVMAQLEAIKANETEMGELWNQLDLAKLNAVINATYAANTLEGCVCTAKCDTATTACVYCLTNTCPRGEAVAKIGEVGYDSLQSAVDAAKNGDVITLCQDINGPITVTQKPDVAFTIDGAGKTMTNSITVDGKSARYPTAGLTIKNINFTGSSVTGEAFINLGVSGDNNTRYTSNVSVQGCSFSSTGNTVPCIKSYTGGDTNLSVIGCTANAGTHSLLQVDNVEGKLTISGNKVYSKNGINLNSSGNVEITNNDISVSGYAVRTGASSGTAVTPSIVLSGNTLATNNSEGDPVIVVRSTTESATITMSENSVSGDTHIGGNTENTTVNADGNYWDGEDAPKTSGTSVEVLTYYSDPGRTDLVVSPNVIASIGDELYLSLQEANTDATSGDTIILLKDITLTPEGIVHLNDGVTLDLNGKNLLGTVTGKLSVNGGSWTTNDSHKYKMVCSGTNTDKADYFYISDDGVFDANVHGDLSVLSGTVTVSKNARTVPGQTVTIASGASFIVPTGKEFEVLGTAVVNGTVVVDGTVILGSDADADHVTATKDASLTAPAGLNVVSGIDGYTVFYDGSKYSIAPASTAPIVATIGGNNFSTLQAALDAAKDGDTVELESSVSENATVKSDITLKLNGKTVGGISVGSDALTNIPTLTISASDAASIAGGIDLVWGYVEIGGNALGAKSGNVKSDSNGNMTLVLPTANDNLAFAGAYQILPNADNSAVTSKADGTVELPANSTVVLTDKHSVYIVNSGAQIDKNGKLSLLPVEVTDMTGKSFGYAVTIVSETVGESSSDDAILSPLHPEAGDPYKLTIAPSSNGELVYDCPDAKEAPIVDDKADGKDYLKFIKKDKYFYKYGAGRMYFTCNGFMDCLKSIKVDGKELDSSTDYILDRGSTIVTLRNGYLKNLALGKHTLTLTYEDGQSISTEFTVGETPATGDSGYGIFAAGMGISLMGMLCVLFVLKKKRANN